MASSRKRSKSRKESSKESIKKEQEVKSISKSVSTNLRSSEKIAGDMNSEIWTPGSYVALKALISARLCSAIWGILNDCDETYNYWEPTHFLLYGEGFQTWEYSPVYALRSYTYLMLHAAPAYLYSRGLQPNRMLVFFFIRCMLALISSLCELYFYWGVCKSFGSNVGRIALGLTICSSGMFISTTAYLPSSFSMYMTMLSYGAWFHGRWEFAIFTTALSVFLGWPFVALIGFPIAFDILVLKRKYVLFSKWGFISAFTILAPMIQYDTAFFGRLVVAPLNLVLYNVFSSKGPELYGTAPISFYILNGILNFNILFPIALFSLPLYVILVYLKAIPRVLILAPNVLTFGAMYLWFLVFFTQPHKEERFLFPVYPLIILSAAFGIDTFQKLFFTVFAKNKKSFYLNNTSWIALSLIGFTSIISISRIIGQYQGYRAPIDTFLELQRLEQDKEVPNFRSINVCYGREWYRFPSSFFLPSPRWKIQFIESEFRGQLPKPFSSEYSNATSIIPDHMNDDNKEERSRYVPISSCHFLIDIDKEEQSPREPRYSLQTSNWKIIHRVPFLDAHKSPQLFRAFYIPLLTESTCTFVDYVILQSTRLRKMLQEEVNSFL